MSWLDQKICCWDFPTDQQLHSLHPPLENTCVENWSLSLTMSRAVDLTDFSKPFNRQLKPFSDRKPLKPLNGFWFKNRFRKFVARSNGQFF